MLLCWNSDWLYNGCPACFVLHRIYLYLSWLPKKAVFGNGLLVKTCPIQVCCYYLARYFNQQTTPVKVAQKRLQQTSFYLLPVCLLYCFQVVYTYDGKTVYWMYISSKFPLLYTEPRENSLYRLGYEKIIRGAEMISYFDRWCQTMTVMSPK